MMYDQGLRAQRDYQWGLDSAREEGRQEGLQEVRQERELVGKTRLLQELLGEESSSTENLGDRTISELSGILADLQQRLRPRQS